MMMFGPRLNTVFASRWKAAFWAVSVLISAYFMVPSPSETHASGQADTSAQDAASIVAQISGAQAAAEAPAEASPWGK
jgi:hypothetical protein